MLLRLSSQLCAPNAPADVGPVRRVIFAMGGYFYLLLQAQRQVHRILDPSPKEASREAIRLVPGQPQRQLICIWKTTFKNNMAPRPCAKMELKDIIHNYPACNERSGHGAWRLGIKDLLMRSGDI